VVPGGGTAGAAPANAGSGALCTGPRGAGSGFGAGPAGAGDGGGPEAAAKDALAGVDPAATGAPGGGGGGIVPVPNNDGDAWGDDGSAIGAAAAMYSAWARSATRPWVIFSSSAWSGTAGFAGTVARFG
jgi:hypothetical protein